MDSVTLNILIRAIDRLATSINNPSGGGIERTPTRSVTTAVGAGAVAAGARSVTIELSSDFTGSILGDADINNGGTITPGASYNFAVNQNNDTLGAIAYVLTTGTITITKIV